MTVYPFNSAEESKALSDFTQGLLGASNRFWLGLTDAG